MEMGIWMKLLVDGGPTTHTPSQTTALGAMWIVWLVGKGAAEDPKAKKILPNT